MFILVTSYPNKSRELKKFILGMVKSGIVSCVQRINYVKSYYMREGKLCQSEEKLLICKFDEANKAKVQAYIDKNHPYQTPECIYLQPDDVNQAYAQRITHSSSHHHG